MISRPGCENITNETQLQLIMIAMPSALSHSDRSVKSNYVKGKDLLHTQF